ncbi:metal ABC transporter ATP-binding protein [Salinicoccus halodurans]|uniref:Manganese/zinc/iron transport system ATP-binding protein n=1 Tax=Salinicoccus halodurans TaxID=407035 RepID=A0A0F7HK04_9STAP|nr:metal ABC transporter ATP-binding protein [Salinicoccus halodurans]AKG73057.1 peptide transporter [Salinicoccus halodurans]SFK78219.1 manganese/zinc/iron transport system ATP-binding protein [Salinicoccus halodurans]
MEEDIITIRDLNVAYQDKPALWHINLDIKENSRTAIVGPNGAGKSTMIKTVMKLIRPVSGNIKIAGRTDKGVLKTIAYVPQKGEVNWDFPTTVLDVVLMGRYVHKGWIKRPNRKDKEIALKALKTMKMEAFRDRQISELSGGQRQRAFLARAIAQDADIYVMDEPLQGIDITTENLIIDVIRQLQEDGKTFIVVHHQLNTVKEYFDHVVILNKTVIASGPVDAVFTEENIETAYREKGIRT